MQIDTRNEQNESANLKLTINYVGMGDFHLSQILASN